jgi:hypothetical protein
MPIVTDWGRGDLAGLEELGEGPCLDVPTAEVQAADRPGSLRDPDDPGRLGYHDPTMGKDVYYITTPIYYPNDVPHIGHAYNAVRDGLHRPVPPASAVRMSST